ncbi:hypothetical protein, partial [Anaerovibrio sp. JC8]|uniref:hypothetical protein n=1 Tax=Anaerovibrio sp. JC8 TaxID=1240085 RepID=UPI001177CD24
MRTEKHRSPLEKDNSTSKANKGNGWKGLKGQAALALAVSLWIAGGSVEAAVEDGWLFLQVDNN